MRNSNETAYEEYLFSSYVKQMSNQHSSQALSWRKLYLGRAKLKATSRTSALLSGFAMVALVEIQVEKDVPSELMIAFSVCTTLLVSVHLLALMISTCILPNIEAVSNVHNVNAVHESPHEQMQIFIQMSWAFSTGLGIILFLAEIAILCWVKFNTEKAGYNKEAAIASTAIVIPVCILFLVFAVYFYRNLVAHKFERTTQGLNELQLIADDLENHSMVANTSTIQNV